MIDEDFYIYNEEGLTLQIPDQPNEITFTVDDMILKLTEKGFDYNGQIIEDAGEAYKLFMEWLNNSRRFI